MKRKKAFHSFYRQKEGNKESFLLISISSLFLSLFYLFLSFFYLFLSLSSMAMIGLRQESKRALFFSTTILIRALESLARPMSSDWPVGSVPGSVQEAKVLSFTHEGRPSAPSMVIYERDPIRNHRTYAHGRRRRRGGRLQRLSPPQN